MCERIAGKNPTAILLGETVLYDFEVLTKSGRCRGR